MLERITIHNYKCLLDLTLDLGMFNVLIGPNDSGKTSVLDAIHLLNLLVHANNTKDAFQKHGNPVDLISHGTENREIAFDTKVDGMPYSISLDMQSEITHESLGGNFTRNSDGHCRGDMAGVFPKRVSRFVPVIDALAPPAAKEEEALKAAKAVRTSLAAMRCNLRPESVRQPTAPAGDQPDPALEPTGLGLPTVLDYMLLTDRRRFEDLENRLKELMPHLDQLQLLPKQGKREVAFLLRGDDEPVPASLASDGLLHMLGFLTLLSLPGVRPSILLVDEPENGIHPGALREVVGILRELVEKENVQVVMTTHSPYLLDLVQPEEVYILTRAHEGDLRTKATRMSEIPKIEILRKGYELGELWTNYGEQALVEGGE